MTFQTFLAQAWSDHTKDPKKVSKTFIPAFSYIEESVQVIQLAQLITHVMGEHLFKWSEGIHLLHNLGNHQKARNNQDCQDAIQRSIATLRVCDDLTYSLSQFSNSDQIRILATAASALSAYNKTAKAKLLLKRATDQATVGVVKEDPANRALAIAGNNLASSLEEKEKRTAEEDELMIFAAQVARKYWELAGTWLEIERAEYRLAQSFLKTKNIVQARIHAKSCLEICQKNKAPALEFFFAYEAKALIEKTSNQTQELAQTLSEMKKQFSQLSEDEKMWCEDTLNNLSIKL